MLYDKDLYYKVQNDILLKKRKREFEAYKRQEKFFSENPEAKVINEKILKFSFESIKKILNKNDKNINEIKKNRKELSNYLTKILLKKGLPLDYLDVEYDCKACFDTGKIQGEFCSCAIKYMKEELIKRFKNNSMLGSKLLKNTNFEDFSLKYYSNSETYVGFTEFEIMENIFKKCKNYAKKFSLKSPNLLMVGMTGLGKTHLSVSITKCVLKSGFNAIYSSSPNLVEILKKDKLDESFELGNEINFIKCDLLVIDDLGTEFNTKFSSAILYNLINSRILNGLPSIISTNLSMKEIAQNYKPILASRIIGHFERLGFVGKDIRQQKTIENLK